MSKSKAYSRLEMLGKGASALARKAVVMARWAKVKKGKPKK